MPLVIWKLPHPVRGIATFLGVLFTGALIGGFGIGVPELVVLALLAGGAFVIASTRTSGDIGASR